MRRIAMAGSFALALTLGGCAALQDTRINASRERSADRAEAAPQAEATPTPLTGAEILAQQPAEVREAIKEHDQSGKWPMYKTARQVIYPFIRARAGSGLRAATDHRHPATGG